MKATPSKEFLAACTSDGVEKRERWNEKASKGLREDGSVNGP